MAIEQRLLTRAHDTGVAIDRLRRRVIFERRTRTGDRFLFGVGAVRQLAEDGAGQVTWRAKIAAELAGKPFGGLQLDVSPRLHELDTTDRMQLPNSLAFAGIVTPEIEVVEVDRHAAEKLRSLPRSLS